MTNLSLAKFNGVSLNIIDHAGRKWLTAEQAGQCLGYSEANSSQGVRNLFVRHADEFSDADTCQLKTMTAGQMREVRVFSDTGCIKLGFFSNTGKAKEFRNFAAKTLAGQSPDTGRQAALESRVAVLEQGCFNANPQWVALARYRAMGLSYLEIGKLTGWSDSTQGRLVRAAREAGLGHLMPATATAPVGRKLPAVDAAQMSLGM